jgi:predicted nucleic acid-binding protein
LSVVFVDTSAILALLNPKDEHHRRAHNAFASW